MKAPPRWLSWLIVLLLGWAAGWVGYSLVDKLPPQVQKVVWNPRVHWIASPQPAYRFYARHVFELGSEPLGAWLRISADNQYKLFINGQLVDFQVKTSNSSPYRLSGRNLGEQNFNDSLSYGAKVIATYQLDHNQEWQLPGYIDITRYLKLGRNVLAVEVQKGRKAARLAVEGGVYTIRGDLSIDLSTGTTLWRTSQLSSVRMEKPWNDPQFVDLQWTPATDLGSVTESTYSRLSPLLYSQLLDGFWIGGKQSSAHDSWLQTTWSLPTDRLRGYLRFAARGEYEILLNGLLLKHFDAEDGSLLHMYDVSNFLHAGVNTLQIHLSQPLQPSPSEILSGAFLDGWVEDGNGMLLSTVRTDATWQTAPDPSLQASSTANVLAVPIPKSFTRTYEGDGYLLNYPDVLVHTTIWCLGGILLSALTVALLGRLWLGWLAGWGTCFDAGAALAFPSALYLLAVDLFAHRYAEAERGLLFVQPSSVLLELAGLAGVFSLTLACALTWRWLRSKTPIKFSLHKPLVDLADQLHVQGGRLLLWNIKHPWLLVGLTMLFGLMLRIHKLGLVAYDSDENTSLDATRGILRTGLPIASSGILYSRGPAFHYLLALWLRLFGDSITNARMLSALFGTAALLFVFLLTRKLTGNLWLALLCTFLIAIDPWEIFYSRNNRFYEMTQFGILAATWFFYPAFVEQRSRKYQYLFFAALLFSLLTQEVTLALLPGYLLGFLCFYKPFRLREDWQIIACSALVLEFYAIDIVIALWLHLTPWVALSSTTEALMKLHITDVTVFFLGLFCGNNRMFTLYSLFFFAGFFYSLWRRDGKVLFVYNLVLVGLLGLTILVLANGARYFYSLYPLFVILSVYSAFQLSGLVGEQFSTHVQLPLKALAFGWCLLVLAGNLEFERILGSYGNEYARRSPDVFEYIKTHRSPGDVVLANLPSASAISLGGVSYYLPPNGQPPLDGLYMRDGRIIDRWGGGIVVTNIDQLSHILEKSDRVWIHLDDNIRPSETDRAQFYDYFNNLGQAVMESYGVRLRLWQKGDGILPRIPNEGKDLGTY
jgi:4-amino-4-deoxy-L-arabinose transferase-like glycosyltransferase